MVLGTVRLAHGWPGSPHVPPRARAAWTGEPHSLQSSGLLGFMSQRLLKILEGIMYHG